MKILEALRSTPQTVSVLVNLTGLSQLNTSYHLSCLLDCGVVERVKQGRNAVYSIADRRIVTLLALADEVLGRMGIYGLFHPVIHGSLEKRYWVSIH